MDNKRNYIWYASYGSNINRDRFLCYIKGGQPEGSDKKEIGCDDKSLPLKETTYLMHHPLYFAMASERWQKQGVAFIGWKRDEDYRTYSRKYLITVDQFKDVVKQENNGTICNLDINEVMEKGLKTFRDTWYGTILYLGEDDGYPIVTFTADWDLDVPFTKPSKEYLTIIIKGLKLTLKLSDEEIADYICSKPGTDGNYTKSDIKSLSSPVK